MASNGVLVCLILPILINVGLYSCHSQDVGSDTLKLVVTLFRHGDRTPDLSTIYPKDPFKHETYMPYDYGQLTNNGKNRAYGLGQTLRTLYNSFLGPLYVPGKLQPVSTNYDRTKCTLQLVLAGLFPPVGTELEWNKNLNWNPIPTGLEEELLKIPLYSCPKYKEAFETYLKSPDHLAVMEGYKDIFPYVSEHSGLTITSLTDMAAVAFALISESEWGLQLPEWTKRIHPIVTSEAVSDVFYQSVATTDLNRLFGGPLLKKILNDIHLQINGTSGHTKMYIYSAHDIQVVSLLSVLKVYFKHAPNYNACVLIELHKIGGENFIKVRYNKENTYSFVDMVVPGCQAMCPINDFVQLLQDHIPGDGDICAIQKE